MTPERTSRSVLAAAAALTVLLAACGAETPGSPLVPVEVAGRPQRGPADAWVTIVEFGEFQCPFCAAAEPTLATLRAEYGADLRLVFRHLPLARHARARPAALAAECGFAQGRFWELHDLLFEAGADLSDEGLEARAVSAGLDLEAWRACTSSAAAAAAVDADVEAAADAGVGGTPTFYVNGVPLEGNAPLATFRAVVDRALARALASGLPRDRYYDAAVLGR